MPSAHSVSSSRASEAHARSRERCRPRLLRGDEQLLVQLRDVRQPNLDAYRRGSLRYGATEPVHDAAGRCRTRLRCAGRSAGGWSSLLTLSASGGLLGPVHSQSQRRRSSLTVDACGRPFSGAASRSIPARVAARASSTRASNLCVRSSDVTKRAKAAAGPQLSVNVNGRRRSLLDLTADRNGFEQPKRCLV